MAPHHCCGTPSQAKSQSKDQKHGHLHLRVMNAMTEGRWKGPDPENNQHHLQPGTVAVTANGGSPGLDKKLHEPFKLSHETGGDGEDAEDEDAVEEEEDASGEEANKPKSHKFEYSVVLSEESLAKKRKRPKGTATLKQVQELKCAHGAGSLYFPEEAKWFHPGSSVGSAFEHVDLCPFDGDQSWLLQVETKFVYYGEKVKPVRGRDLESFEPPCWWPYPMTLWRDLFARRLQCRLVIDGTPTKEVIEACALERIAYICVCATETQQQELQDHTIERFQKFVAEPKNPYTNIRYRVALGIKGDADDTNTGSTKHERVRKRQRGAQAKTQNQQPVEVEVPQEPQSKRKRNGDLAGDVSLGMASLRRGRAIRKVGTH